MPLLSSHLLIHGSSLTFAFLSYLLLTSPLSILQSPSVDLLGSSMHVAPAMFVPVPNPLTSSLTRSSSTLPQSSRELLALVALLLVLAALSQSVLATGLAYSRDGLLTNRGEDGKRRDSRALGEAVHTLHSAQSQWMVLAGLRVLVTGVLVAWIYLGHGGRSGAGAGMTLNSAAEAKGQSLAGGMGLLANRIVFAVAMSDMLFWGYVWTVLKEEAREVLEIIAKRRAQDEEDDQNERR